MNEFPPTDSPQKVGENSFFFLIKMSSFTLERKHIKMREGREGENLQAGHGAQHGADPTTHKILI